MRTRHFSHPSNFKQYANLLNTVREDYLATEWEQAVLNAASKVGSVRHEPPLGRKPDLWLNSSKPPLEFIADVATASDRGLHERNPVDALQEEFSRQLQE
jgi:hypothetical protein